MIINENNFKRRSLNEIKENAKKRRDIVVKNNIVHQNHKIINDFFSDLEFEVLDNIK